VVFATLSRSKVENCGPTGIYFEQKIEEEYSLKQKWWKFWK
jgi:hypothetical protein